jgi:hypothetical protein
VGAPEQPDAEEHHEFDVVDAGGEVEVQRYRPDCREQGLGGHLRSPPAVAAFGDIGSGRRQRQVEVPGEHLVEADGDDDHVERGQRDDWLDHPERVREHGEYREQCNTGDSFERCACHCSIADTSQLNIGRSVFTF